MPETYPTISACRITTADDRSFDCQPGDTILRAALRAGVGMGYSCNVGSCGNCRFELLSGEVKHLHPDPPAWSERDLKRSRYLGCQAAPMSDCVIKFYPDEAAALGPRPARRIGEIISMTRVTQDISELAVCIDGDDGFRPGQYALISVPDIAGGRPYSMCNLSGEGVWKFHIRRTAKGSMTGHLFDVADIGSEIFVDGPYGTAYLDLDSPRDIVLIAGGSGLSPMASIARGAEKSGMLDDRKLYFFYGGRTEDDLFDPGILGSVADRISFTAALSDAGPDWEGSTGFIHEVVESILGDRLEDAEIYFAGPSLMAQAVRNMARSREIPAERLHFDEFY